MKSSVGAPASALAVLEAARQARLAAQGGINAAKAARLTKRMPAWSKRASLGRAAALADLRRRAAGLARVTVSSDACKAKHRRYNASTAGTKRTQRYIRKLGKTRAQREARERAKLGMRRLRARRRQAA